MHTLLPTLGAALNTARQIASLLHTHPGAVAVGARVDANGKGAPRLFEGRGLCGRLRGKITEAPAGYGGRRHGLHGEALTNTGQRLATEAATLGVGAALQ